MMLVVVFVHYEGFSFITKHVEKFRKREQHRWFLMLILLGIMAIHCIEIWLYAFAFAGLDYTKMGQLVTAPGLPEIGQYGVHYVYYAGVVYTSLGFGDIAPTGAARILSASAGLVGLLLIAWSASFTYLSMQNLWHKN